METGSDEAVGDPNSSLKLWPMVVMIIICAFVVGVVVGFVKAMNRNQVTKPTLENLKRLSWAGRMYSADHDDSSVLAAGWNASLATYYQKKEVLLDYHIELPAERRGIGINPESCGVKQSAIVLPERTITFALTMDPGQDALVSRKRLRSYDEDIDASLIATANGRAVRRFFSQIDSYKWIPGPTEATGR